MITGDFLLEQLVEAGIGFFSGVPDSTLASFCLALENSRAGIHHIVAADEGGAVALAAGYHIATGRLPSVYLQNSGLGNAVNPMVSLADASMFKVPILLLISWRGRPGEIDAQQHQRQGEITVDILRILEIPWEVLAADEGIVKEQICRCASSATSRSGAIALLVPRDVLEVRTADLYPKSGRLSVREAIACILEALGSSTLVVGSTGQICREISKWHESCQVEFDRTLLVPGSMGHSSMVALGLAESTSRRVCCIEGDGAALMHLGAFAVIGGRREHVSFLHAVLNDGRHCSIGGLRRGGGSIDFFTVGAGCGYDISCQCTTESEIVEAVRRFIRLDCVSLLEVEVECDPGRIPPRADLTPEENRDIVRKALWK